MNPDATFFMNMGVPDSNGVSHPKAYPFYGSATNPNPTGRCLCERSDGQGPFLVFPGDMYDIGSPRPVLCAGCAVDCAALVDGSELPEAVLEVTPPTIELPAEAVEEDEDKVEGL